MSTPQRITQRHDAAFRRRELIDEPVNPFDEMDMQQRGFEPDREILLVALRKTNRRKCRSGIVAAGILFAAFAWAACLWLTRHFLP